MSEHLISMFIDDEMNLAEKGEFVESIHSDASFKNETQSLLNQEKMLRSYIRFPLTSSARSSKLKQRKRQITWNRPLILVPVALCLMLAVVTTLQLNFKQPVLHHENYRFVLYLPDEAQPAIVGSFTAWNPIPLKRVGSTGYWSVTLKVPTGEHRYSFQLGQNRLMADPTVTAREQDDFGGENSIIYVSNHDDSLS